MTKKRRAKGSGCLFKKSNGRYAYRYVDFQGTTKTQTLCTPDGTPVTNYENALQVVNTLQQQFQDAASISTKTEYLAKVAEYKKLICVNDFKISEIWERYLNSASRPDSGTTTLEFYHKAVRIFQRWLLVNHPEKNLVRHIDSEITNEFAIYYWRTGISERTYNARINSLKLIFKTLLKDNNPFADIRIKTEQQQTRKAFTAEQLQAIFAKLDEPTYYMLYKDQMKLMLQIMLYTGCRGEDACLMQWSSVDIAAHEFVFTPLKTARKHPEPVHIPMANVLFQQLSRLTEHSTTEYVLPEVAERYKRNPSGISVDVSKLLVAAGIKTTKSKNHLHRQRAVVEYSMHSFRHTFCSMAANAGIDLHVIQSMVGHTQVVMTEHYTHYSFDAKRKAIEALPYI